jgi:hypothetical protein
MEMLANSKLRQVEKSNALINEVMSGTGHLIRLISVNNRLLQGLQKSVPPALIDQEDICRCLMW